MATFEKRGKFWRVKIRRAGVPAQTRSFDNKALAQQSARSVDNLRLKAMAHRPFARIRMAALTS